MAKLSVNQQNVASGPCVHRHIQIAYFAVLNGRGGKAKSAKKKQKKLLFLTQIIIP